MADTVVLSLTLTLGVALLDHDGAPVPLSDTLPVIERELLLVPLSEPLPLPLLLSLPAPVLEPVSLIDGDGDGDTELVWLSLLVSDEADVVDNESLPLLMSVRDHDTLPLPLAAVVADGDIPVTVALRVADTLPLSLPLAVALTLWLALRVTVSVAVAVTLTLTVMDGVMLAEGVSDGALCVDVSVPVALEDAELVTLTVGVSAPDALVVLDRVLLK